MSLARLVLVALFSIGLQAAVGKGGSSSSGGGGRGGSSSSSSRGSSSSSSASRGTTTSRGGTYFGSRNTIIPPTSYGTSYILVLPLLLSQPRASWAIYTDAGAADCSLTVTNSSFSSSSPNATITTTAGALPPTFNSSTVVADAYTALRLANSSDVTLLALNSSVASASNQAAYLTDCVSAAAGHLGRAPLHAMLMPFAALLLLGAMLS